MIGGHILRRRLQKCVLAGIGLLMALSLVGLLYFWTGTANSLTRVSYRLVVDDPGSGIATVHMQIQPTACVKTAF